MAQERASARPRAEEQTRERILGVAAEWFATRGYAATSIRDIARAVGVTVGAIYVHFPSKGRLLAAVYQHGVERIGRAVEAAIAKADGPWEKLTAAAEAHLKMLLDDAGFARVIVRVIPADVPEVAGDLERLRDGYEQRFRALIAALDLPGGSDPTLVRLMLLGALNATQAWYRPKAGGTSAAAIARAYVAVVRDGVARSRSPA